MKYVVCYSGGHSSALAAIETVRRYGSENVILLNHDISSKVEHSKIKIFKQEVAEFLHLPITYANCKNYEDATPLSLCLEHGRFKFRAGCEICTYYLKTKPFHEWLKNNYPVNPGFASKEITLIYGFDSTEWHRIDRRRRHLNCLGYESMYPLAEWDRTFRNIEEVGLKKPSLYADSKHANCIGCLKAGKQHWYKVYCCNREIFDEAKFVEDKLNHSIIKGAYMKDLEPEFERMYLAGVPATEIMETHWFWKYAKQCR